MDHQRFHLIEGNTELWNQEWLHRGLKRHAKPNFHHYYYYCMHYQGKPMIQTWENGQKTSILGPKLGPEFVFFANLSVLIIRYHSHLSLYTVSGKTNDPNSKNDQKPQCRAIFGPFWLKLGPEFFFLADLSALRYHSLLSLYASSENMIQTWENDKLGFWSKLGTPG